MPAARTYEGVIPDYCQPIPGAPDYYADREGNIYSAKKRKFFVMKSKPTSDGYLYVTLWNKDGKVNRSHASHRLIAETFLGSPEGRQVNHINCDRSDNRVENLEWVTLSENIKYMFKLGRAAPYKGTENRLAKFTKEDVYKIRELFASGVTKAEISRIFQATPQIVGRVLNGQSYKDV